MKVFPSSQFSYRRQERSPSENNLIVDISQRYLVILTTVLVPDPTSVVDEIAQNYRPGDVSGNLTDK